MRIVADARKVSVHEILSPAPRVTYVAVPGLLPGEIDRRERIEFDPYAGWSWREVLVWASDAARAAAESRAAGEQADWQRGDELPDYSDYLDDAPADDGG